MIFINNRGNRVLEDESFKLFDGNGLMVKIKLRCAQTLTIIGCYIAPTKNRTRIKQISERLEEKATLAASDSSGR